MTMRLWMAAILSPALLASPASARVLAQSDQGFVVAHSAQVAASPEDVWQMLRKPQDWWSKEHSFSGDAANYWLDAQAGGCLCEKLPAATPGGMPGSVRHLEIIFAQPGRLMRLSGALGPLQGEALVGTLTITIRPTERGSAIRFDYVVGGYSRMPLADVAPAVDRVIGEQLVGLARALGGSLGVEAAPADGDAPPPAPAVPSALDGVELPRPEADVPPQP